MCAAHMPCMYATHKQKIGAVRVHTVRAARVQTAITVHSWGTHSTAFMLLSFCTCPTRAREILKCSTRVAYVSEVCAMRVHVCK